MLSLQMPIPASRYPSKRERRRRCASIPLSKGIDPTLIIDYGQVPIKLDTYSHI